MATDSRLFLTAELRIVVVARGGAELLMRDSDHDAVAGDGDPLAGNGNTLPSEATADADHDIPDQERRVADIAKHQFWRCGVRFRLEQDILDPAENFAVLRFHRVGPQVTRAM